MVCCCVVGYEKLCVRCGKIFEVYPNGKYPVKQDCVYHWGKAWKKKSESLRVFVSIYALLL